MDNLTDENIRIIFGLKVKKLRNDLHLSLQTLSQRSGISISYLNEIENGKKYPKTDKINELSKALGTSYDALVSLKLNKNLAPVGQILNLDLINDFLFETFGIDKATVMNMVANEPVKVSAFINALIEISRNYNLKLEHFFFSCLRSYQELNDNYFEDIEDAVADFIRANNFNNHPSVKLPAYEQALQQLGYTLQQTDFADYPKLKNQRSVTLRNGKTTLLYNKKLTDQQKAFLYGREIGFTWMKMDKRPYTTPWLKVDSFDHVLNNFRAAYFAQALHINKDNLIKDLELFFDAPRFSSGALIGLLDKYNASPEMLLTRITNVLPRYFGINELFFIRYSSKEPEKNLKEISKELHLSRHTANFEYTQTEQNYRRWITKSLLKYTLEHKQAYDTKIEAVISENGNGNQYLTISILRPMEELNNNNNSVTIGFVLTDAVRKKIRFLTDKSLDIAKLGDISRNEFEPVAELRKQKELREKEAELERLMASRV
ncbi:MAG: helix-turn-helix transcriptional regulator [Bacteroidetes bacterium]|nr:helix-turn-helix transcriptional regulator [Bacteroidota bacterium]